jgi:hypothetical protein
VPSLYGFLVDFGADDVTISVFGRPNATFSFGGFNTRWAFTDISNPFTSLSLIGSDLNVDVGISEGELLISIPDNVGFRLGQSARYAIPALGVSFQNVSESSVTDPVPLFGAPSRFLNGLDFNPMSFVAYGLDGGADMAEGRLGFTATSGGAINAIHIAAAGDFALLGEGTSSSQATIAATAFVTVTEINGSAVDPIQLDETLASANYNLVTNPGIAQSWSLDVVVDIAGQLPLGQAATKIEVVIDNRLTAASEPNSVAFIATKDFIVRVDAIVPEPSALGWALVALAGMAPGKGRKRRI